MGALRGLKDTRGPVLVGRGGGVGGGLTSAALFGVYLGFGGRAIWVSLAVALFVVGAFLVRRFWAQSVRLIGVARHST